MNVPYFKLFQVESTHRALALLLLILFVGCGGGMSQEDMKRRAIHRKPDPENQIAVVQKSQSPQPPPAAQPAKTSSPAGEEKQEKQVAEKPAPTDVNATDEQTSVASEATSDTRQKPAEPLSTEERVRISAANLERIGQVLAALVEENGRFPLPAIYDRSGNPLLSWRVRLLPHLGYEKLYSEFDLAKPWNSPANKKLLEKIPAIYQSPERFDSRTNYLLATGTSTVFTGQGSTRLSRIEDGVEHTVVLVEADDSQAVQWTRPQEYEYSAREPKLGLGKLREGHVLVVWGSGITGAVSTSTSPEDFRAMFTMDGGEPFSSYSISKPIDEEFFAQFGEQNPTAQGNLAIASSPDQPNAPAILRAPASSLARDYSEAAHIANAMNEPADALLWFYASQVVQPSVASGGQDYRWVPALQRPSPTVHFGVGVRGSSGTLRRRARSRNTRNRSNPERAKIVNEISDVGEKLLGIIEEHAVSLVPQALAGTAATATPASRSKSRRGSSQDAAIPVSYLGKASRSELTQEAVDSACDVLVLFETEESPSGVTRQVSCDLIDLIRGKKIVSIPAIHWRVGTSVSKLMEEDETFQEKFWELSDALEDRFVFQDWPEGLKSRHVQARIASLAEKKTFNMLAALAEVSMYASRGLIDRQQLLDGFRGLLGDEDGEILMLGSDSRRKRILRKWLPAEDPSELQQLANSRRSTRGEDD